MRLHSQHAARPAALTWTARVQLPLRGICSSVSAPIVPRAILAAADHRNSDPQERDEEDSLETRGRVLRPRRSLFNSDGTDGNASDGNEEGSSRRRPPQSYGRRADRYGEADGEEGRPSTSGGERSRYGGSDRKDRYGPRFDSSRNEDEDRDTDRAGRRNSGYRGRDSDGGYDRGRRDRDGGGGGEADARDGRGGGRDWQQRSRNRDWDAGTARRPFERRERSGSEDGGRGDRGGRGDWQRDRDRGRDAVGERRPFERRERGGGGGGGGRGNPDREGSGYRRSGERDFEGRREDGRWRSRRGDPDERDARRGEEAAAATGADTAEAAPAPAPRAPRPPGSSTGNRPLPYDLPIVRQGDGDKGTFFAGPDWRHVGASEEVTAALRALGILRPSHIQAQAFPALLRTHGRRTGGSGGSGGPSGPSAVALADQAGSGKTLAYLLPLLQMLRQEEAAAGGRVTKPNCPRGIVVAPTTELVQQVQRVARALSGAGLRLRSAAFTGGQAEEKARAASMRTQRDLLNEGVDLVIATPGRLQRLLELGHLRLDECRLLVLDEVDILMGAQTDFMPQVAPLRAAAPPSARFVLVSATLPAFALAQLREVWPDVEPVFGPGLHRTAAGLVEELVDCSGGDEVSEESGRKRKLEALQALLDRHRSPRTIVFCNKIDACRDVENFLKRADPQEAKYRVLPYHEAIRDDLRSANLVEFLRPVDRVAAAAAAAARQQQQQQERQKRQEARGDLDAEGDVDPKEQPAAAPAAEGGGPPGVVLVATDRTSRGIDAHDCGHVVLFDFPRDPSEYVRRVGRTARGAGGRGTVSSLVLGRQVPLAREIIDRNQKGMPVHSVPQ